MRRITDGLTLILVGVALTMCASRPPVRIPVQAPVQTPTQTAAAPSVATQPTPAQQPPEETAPTITATGFDSQWLAVRPRTPEGVYPNLPAGRAAMPNPRYEVPAGRPLAGLRICVDAGHGGQVWGPTHGYTGGTRGGNTRFTESEANLRAALFLWDLLTQAGADVVMTRTRPERLTAAGTEAREELHERVAIAEREGCDYFVAIHHNAPGGNHPETNYTSAYYYDTSQYDAAYNENPAYVHRYPDEELNTERWQLALSIQRALVRNLELPEIVLPNDWGAHYGHGVPHGDFHVIRETNLPAVLAECSFMTNPEEDLRLNDPRRAKQEAIAIFEGILEHFATHPIRRWSVRPPAGPSAAE